MNGDISFFKNDDSLVSWITDTAETPEIIGNLCPDCIPVGSWVKNAVRNFEDPDVDVVCGPVIPGDYSSRLERIAGLVFSSIITRGQEAYLYSYRPVQNVAKGLSGSIFLRRKLLAEKKPEEYGYIRNKRFISSGDLSNGIIRYDPDAAVMKKVPPLFLPYFRYAAHESFSDGCDAVRSHGSKGNFWPISLTILWIVLLAGWTVLSAEVCKILWIIYLTVIFVTSLSCLDPLSVPLFFTGIIGNHVIKAIAFPAGILSGILRKKKHT